MGPLRTRPGELVPHDVPVGDHELTDAPTFRLVGDLRHRHDRES
jgi:hypothetical protein